MPVEIEKHFPKRGEVLRVMREEQRKALTETGRFIRAKAAKYPEKASSASYKRTGTLGRSIAVSEPRAGEGGTFVEVGTNLHYAKYVEYGTGIYGPKGQPIKPKTAKALAWRSVGGGAKMIAFGLAMRKGKAVRAQKKDVYMNFATQREGDEALAFHGEGVQGSGEPGVFQAADRGDVQTDQSADRGGNMTGILGEVGAALAIALFLATVNKALLDLIVAPVRTKWPGVDLWWVNYLALLTGALLAWVFNVNLLAALAGGEPARITGIVITGLVIGGGTDLINDLFSGVQGRTTTRAVNAECGARCGADGGGPAGHACGAGRPLGWEPDGGFLLLSGWGRF